MTASPAVRYRVKHVTEVRYDALVKLARFNLRLKPAPWSGQTLLDYRLDVSPAPKTIIEESGPFVVNVSRLSLDKPTAQLVVTSEFTVDVDRPPPDPGTAAPTVAEVRRDALKARGLSAAEPAPYLFASPIAAMAPEIGDWASSHLATDNDIVSAALALMKAVHSEFTYDSTATSVKTPPLEAFRQRHGVCQDFTHVMIIALRQFGVPAGYVSGYLRTIPPQGRPSLVGADATHAWVNVWCGTELGWIGFDPTNAMLAGNDHIFTAMGRDFADVSPVDGVFIGGRGQRMKVAVEVTPLTVFAPNEAP